ncbi:MAG: hypothetical protein PHX51_08480 [Clostridia bacterium]|nr:hypothetical protein [Clostridia bacterium]
MGDKFFEPKYKEDDLRPKMSAAEFDYERWRGDYFIGVSVRYDDKETFYKMLRRYCVGWCYSIDCHIRPQTESIAVMLNYNIDGEDDIGWFHIPFWILIQDNLDKLFDGVEVPAKIIKQYRQTL